MSKEPISILAEVEEALCKAAGSLETIVLELPLMLRAALDEIIDTVRTGRIYVRQLEKEEKAYIGKKVEIVLRDYFGFPKGELDMVVATHDVDIKNTTRSTWMVPPEAVGKVCLLVKEDDEKAKCSAGLIIASLDDLTKGANQDKKRSISAAGKKNIRWLFRDVRMPSFWAEHPGEVVASIMDSSVAGTERLRRLFTLVQNQPIPRDIIEKVARQKDPLKRLRKNGGARDPLSREGIAILSGAYDTDTIEALGLPICKREEFISFAPHVDEQRKLLQRTGHLSLT